MASMELLRKLEENKMGGIDPIDSIQRIMVHRDSDQKGDPTLYLTSAEFKSRYELELKGKGRTAASINDFFKKLVENEVLETPKKRPEMKSLADGWVSFDASIQMKDRKPEDSTATDQATGGEKSASEEG